MSIDIRLPNINGKTDSEQLAQIRSYLYQFASQLQWALGAVEAGNGSNATSQNNTSGVSKKEDPASNPESIFANAITALQESFKITETTIAIAIAK